MSRHLRWPRSLPRISSLIPLTGLVSLSCLTLAFGLVVACPGSAFAHGGAYQPPPDPPPRPEGEFPNGGGAPSEPPEPPRIEAPPPKGDPEEPPPPEEPPYGTPGSGPTGDEAPPPGGGPETPTGPNRAPNKAGARSSDHWTRWWYPNRDLIVDLVARTSAQNVTPASRVDGGAELWREEAKAALAAALASDNEDVASGAAIALGKSGDAAHADALVAVLLDDKRHQPTREAAALALGLLPAADGDHHVGAQQVLDALQIVAASDREPDRLRGIAVYGLGLRGELASVPFVMELASSAPRATWDVVAAATSSLGLLGHDIAVPELTSLLSAGRNKVERKRERVRRIYAAHALARLGTAEVLAPLHEAAADKDDAVRSAAVLALGAVDAAREDEATIRLLVRALHRDKDVAVRNMAALSLGRLAHEDGIEALRYGYLKGDGLHQPYAALGLGLMARRRDEPKLVGKLIDDLARRANSDLRGALAIAIGLSGNTEGVEVLRGIVSDRGDPELRAHAALALGLLGDAASAPILREQIESPSSPSLQRETALALGLMGDHQAVRLLVGMVRDGSTVYTQGSAAVALGRIGGKESVQALTELLQDDSRPGLARGLAAVGLGMLLDRTEGRGLARVGSDLQWYSFTSAVAEVVTIL